ncbi:Uncharacterised protein [Klebsiella pneumoniae]|nr:Uncharacterised protein [Klebsiella pneumoniae]
MAHQLERDIKTFYKRAQRFVIADNRGDFYIQAAIVGFHQQIAEAVRFFGDQNDDPAASCRVELTN